MAPSILTVPVVWLLGFILPVSIPAVTPIPKGLTLLYE